MRSDARKRQAEDHQAHPDPTVAKLIEDAWHAGFTAGATEFADEIDAREETR
ncbi:MAG: hypothetical protein ACRDYZ_11980 [Acidimicrobiales bacterium]